MDDLFTIYLVFLLSGWSYMACYPVKTIVSLHKLCSGHKRPAQLRLVQINFKTCTFDVIEPDMKMTITDTVGNVTDYSNHSSVRLNSYYQVLLAAQWDFSPASPF